MDIGSTILGAVGTAALKALGLIPWEVWAVLALAGVVAIFVIRVITDWRVVLPLVGVLALAGVILGYRAHWIAMGYAEAQVQVKAAEAKARADDRTVLAVMNCYTEPGRVWDRTQMKCLRVDGAIP
jgi:hypothetical protein